MTQWEEAQKWEKSWWKNCSNTVWEDVKQINLAKYLGLKVIPNEYTQYRIPLKGQSVLDIGGGPSSLLLKCENYRHAAVADPCDYPNWVKARYEEAKIEWLKIKGEDIPKSLSTNISLIYNCLQHTENPRKIIDNALYVSDEVRIFEWIETGTNAGHPHTFTESQFNEWLGGEGKTVNLSSNGLFGKAYYGIFKGRTFKEDRV